MYLNVDSHTECVEKLDPKALRISGKFLAILGAMLDQDWTSPRLAEVMLTSDDFLLGRAEGDIGFNEFLGCGEDLRQNLNGVADAVSLTATARSYLLGLIRSGGA